jgi:hypothetical protein
MDIARVITTVIHTAITTATAMVGTELIDQNLDPLFDNFPKLQATTVAWSFPMGSSNENKPHDFSLLFLDSFVDGIFVDGI